MFSSSEVGGILGPLLAAVLHLGQEVYILLLLPLAPGLMRAYLNLEGSM